MEDVIYLLDLPLPPGGRKSYNVTCPCCDDSPQRKHLNINLEKNVFRCPRCGAHGGVFDLFSLYTGTPLGEVRNVLTERLGHVQHNSCVQSKSRIHEYPITDIESRNATYRDLLSMLSLAPDHRDNLHNRGLSDAEIDRLGYKTSPAIGTTVIAKKLMDNGHYLAGVPGFYRGKDEKWAFVHEQRGILIPARDSDGQIQGLKIRRDNTSKGKFRWVSSVGKNDGCQAKGWTHLAGPVRKQILLTEGPMKADIIHALSGLTVLAVPGVNGLSQLEEALLTLRSKGLEEIMTAFDMDYFTNHYVQSGYNDLLALLERMGFRYGTYLWDPRYKGLDDYIWSLRNQGSQTLLTRAEG